MINTHLKLVTPSIVKRTVTPKRLPNAALRTREHLTGVEVERLMDAARKNRWGHRDAPVIFGFARNRRVANYPRAPAGRLGSEPSQSGWEGTPCSFPITSPSAFSSYWPCGLGWSGFREASALFPPILLATVRRSEAA
jgi:hypothetical protein